MDFSSLATEEWIEELKCTVYNNYLSYFPIHTSSDGKNICGRCPRPSEGYFSNEIYERASRNTTFPCRYKSEGCCEILKPENIPYHEEGCEYKTTKCLTQAFTKCNVKVSGLNMTKHCHEHHSKYFIEDGEFEFDVTKSQKYYYLLEHKNQILFLFGRFNHEDKVYRFVLSHSSYHKLKFTCGSRTLSIKREASDDNNIHEISLDSLISPQASKISAKLYLEAKVDDMRASTKDLNRDSNPNLASLIRNRIHARNTSVDTNKVGKIHRLFARRRYQSLDQLGSQACPLQTFNSCLWTGQAKNLESHFLQDHRSLCANSSYITQNITTVQSNHYVPPSARCNNNFQTIDQCHILKYSQYCFNLFYIKQSEKHYWIMQMMGEFKDMFKYEIEICDDSQKLPQIILTQSCRKQSTRQELMSDLPNYCYISLDQIQNCVNVQKDIPFKVRILKKNQ